MNYLSYEDKNEDCSVIHAPVCGSNKIIYDNDRYSRNTGISEWVESECEFTDGS